MKRLIKTIYSKLHRERVNCIADLTVELRGGNVK